jgi:hypothetical protein
MMLMEPVTYFLQLNTGEEIEVLELDKERIEALRIPEITKSLESLLKLCNSVTRLAVEEAKRRYSHRLEEELRIPPLKAMLKLDKPACIEFKYCPAADDILCVTNEVVKKRKKSLPVCWEYGSYEKDGLKGNNRVMADDLSRSIVHAWNEGRYVLLITG